MKNLQKQIETKLQMTCKQISELTGVRHDSVKRTIETLSNAGVIESPQIVVIKTRTKPRTDYIFTGDQGERDSLVVIAQVSPKATAMLVDEWRSLRLEVDALRKQLADRNAARLQAPDMSLALKESREAQGKPTPSHVYSNDYDMINIIVLGKKAKAYKIDQGLDPKANLRDCMTAAEIHAVKVLQDMNTTLIKVGLDYHERKAKLQDYFMRSLNSLLVVEVLELQS